VALGFLLWIDRQQVSAGKARQRRNSQTSRLSTRLTMIMVVKGAKSLKPGLVDHDVAGRRPRGSFDTQGQSSPTSAIRTPA